MESATATVTNFLSNLISNPFSTPVGQLIEKASDVSQASEDWALYMEICDLINDTEDGAKDAARALKKLISNNVGKSNIVIMYTLTILETCVKNCGKKFHVQIAHKDFLQELIKLASPRNNPPHFVLDKVLGLIQTWADAFQGDPELKEFGNIYQELKEKGCEFPMTDLDHIAPIHTPARTVLQVEPPSHSVTSDSSVNPVALHRHPPEGAATHPALIPVGAGAAVANTVMPNVDEAPVWLDAEQLAKLRSELDVVQQNCRVFGDLLTEVTPGQENADDYKLIKDLQKACHDMQLRIMELIERVQNEDVTGDLLHVNDLLNNISLRYERFERLRLGSSNSLVGLASAQVPQPSALDAATAPAVYPFPTSASASTTRPAHIETGTLVDVSDVNVTMHLSSTASAPPPQLVAPPRGHPVDDEEFDMFAQSRQSFEQNMPKVNSSAYENQGEEQAAVGLARTLKIRGAAFEDNEADEMEQWLKTTEMADTAKDSATSSEFDKFLATRSKESSAQPALETDSLTTGGQRSTRNGRSMQNVDEDDKALFAL